MRIGIAGINGRMGRLLVEQVRTTGLELAGGIDRSPIQADIPAYATIDGLAAACDVVVDFTRADVIALHAKALAAAGTGWVLGTTGADAAAESAIAQAAGSIAIVRAANFSTCVVLMTVLAERLAEALTAAEYDAEIIEMHHRDKLDSPSGTALALGEAVARGRNGRIADLARSARHGVAPRQEGEIGFASLRGGRIVGEHTLSFTSAAEQISLSHRAFDRASFAVGAIRAARWLSGKAPGLYEMREVLGV